MKVDDITSLTKEEEKQRQDTAKKQNNKRKRLSPNNNCTSTPSNSKHVKLTNDVSLLDASIASILSFEKLDKINLYFDFLHQRSLSKQENTSLASSYLYASLDKPENMSSYERSSPPKLCFKLCYAESPIFLILF